MNNTSDMLPYLFSAVGSVLLLLLINRLGGERLKRAKEKLRASPIRWLILAAIMILIVCLLVFRSR